MINRRRFITGAMAAGTGMVTHRTSRASEASRTVVVALMGANDRGSQLAEQFARRSDVQIAYVCDPDERAVTKGVGVVKAQGRPAPQGIRDFRRALDDPAIDALICAAPNHWHAAATVAACAAGKHVYCEKPCSHTPEEGEVMISAAQNSKRVVQVGMQRRSGPLYQKAVERVRDGALGTTRFGKAWYYRVRPSIGRGRIKAPPASLDYSLWQGPAPERPFQDNILHYNWHFFWHWGNAELGNNGVHTIDICRWALGVDFPSRVTVNGHKLRYDDDQQTPDTTFATFECGDKLIAWEAISWSPPGSIRSSVGIELRGDQGTMFIDDLSYTILDLQGKVVEKHSASRGDEEHISNFLDGVRAGTAPNADLTEGHKSAMFCHLGNMAYRCDQSLEIDPSDGRVKNNDKAASYWSREYRRGWSPQELS